MNKGNILKIIMITVEVVMMVALYYSLVTMHENAHAQTMKYFGVKTKILYDWGFPVAVEPVEVESPLSPESWRMLNSLAAMNDIFFYQFQIVFIFFSAIFILLSMMIIAELGE